MLMQEEDRDMTEAEAKVIISHDLYGNVANRLEAIEVATRALGEDATMTEIWKWAEGKTEEAGN